MKTTSTPFAVGDPYAKDQPRTPAGESALDPTIRVAQQGAVEARVKAKQQPITKGSRVTARDNHYRQVIGTGRRVRFDNIPYRVFEGVGEVKSIEDGLARVVAEGRLIIIRIEQLIAVTPEPQPRKVLDDLLYDQPSPYIYGESIQIADRLYRKVSTAWGSRTWEWRLIDRAEMDWIEVANYGIREALDNGKTPYHLIDQAEPCKALVVYEPPQRPVVNVLPKGETPIPLLAPDQKWRNYDENATQKREKYQKLEHEAMGWISQHSDKFYNPGVESQYSKSCHILAMASNEVGHRWQFRGHAGYKNPYAYR